MATVHVPILLDPIVSSLIEALALPQFLQEPCWIVDCTLGGGGHTSEILKQLQLSAEYSHHRVLAVDQDAAAIARAKLRFEREILEGRLELFHGRMSEVLSILKGRKVAGILADLGFSSDQIEDANRGLSFTREGPLDMRLDPDRGRSCLEYLEEVEERELARVLYEFGEERLSRKIARLIIEARDKGELPTTTLGLAELIARAYPREQRFGRIHPATRSFQALRIELNDELKELDCFLSEIIFSLENGGRVAVLSFHSLEDRKVKHAFRDSHGMFLSLTKKPVEADEAELQRNPRSRSAKLRIAERIAQEPIQETELKSARKKRPEYYK